MAENKKPSLPQLQLPSEFLSVEDLDLQNLTEAELDAVLEWWFKEAQASNELDKDSYSHGVFQLVKEPRFD